MSNPQTTGEENVLSEIFEGGRRAYQVGPDIRQAAELALQKTGSFVDHPLSATVASLRKTINHLRDRIASEERRLRDLAHENELLRSEIARLKSAPGEVLQ